MRVIICMCLFSIFFLFSCTDSNTVDKVPEKSLNKYYSEIDSKTLKFSQTVYVPIYSEIYSRSEKHVFQLTSTLSIRNTSLKDSLFVSEINYYNSKGDFVRDYIEKMIFLKPLETIEFIVEEKDISGGMGANFIILWGSNIENLNPIFQGVMIGTSNQQGISFITNGVEISE